MCAAHRNGVGVSLAVKVSGQVGAGPGEQGGHRLRVPHSPPQLPRVPHSPPQGLMGTHPTGPEGFGGLRRAPPHLTPLPAPPLWAARGGSCPQPEVSARAGGSLAGPEPPGSRAGLRPEGNCGAASPAAHTARPAATEQFSAPSVAGVPRPVLGTGAGSFHAEGGASGTLRPGLPSPLRPVPGCSSHLPRAGRPLRKPSRPPRPPGTPGPQASASASLTDRQTHGPSVSQAPRAFCPCCWGPLHLTQPREPPDSAWSGWGGSLAL